MVSKKMQLGNFLALVCGQLGSRLDALRFATPLNTAIH